MIGIDDILAVQKGLKSAERILELLTDAHIAIQKSRNLTAENERNEAGAAAVAAAVASLPKLCPTCPFADRVDKLHCSTDETPAIHESSSSGT